MSYVDRSTEPPGDHSSNRVRNCTAWAPATCVIDEVLLQERVVVTNVTSHSVESASRLNLRIYLEAERLAFVCDSVNYALTSSVQFSPSSDLRRSSEHPG